MAACQIQWQTLRNSKAAEAPIPAFSREVTVFPPKRNSVPVEASSEWLFYYFA